MQISNQQLGVQQKALFTPVASNFTNMGATVTYSIQPSASVNAYNQNIATSGQFVPQQQAGLSNWQSFSQQPYIAAGQYGQFSSGGFQSNQPFGYYQQQQMQPFGQYLSGIMLQPSVDISETTSDVVVTAYVPNHINIADVSLNATDNSISISATGWSGNQSLVIHRTVALPTSIRAEAVDASLQSGVLEIRLPKVEKNVRRRNTVSQDERQTK